MYYIQRSFSPTDKSLFPEHDGGGMFFGEKEAIEAAEEMARHITETNIVVEVVKVVARIHPDYVREAQKKCATM